MTAPSDLWLTAGCGAGVAEHDAYIEWCRDRCLDPDDDHYARFREALDDDYAEWLIGRQEGPR